MSHFFSIVIPTLNEEINLPILLESIAKNDFSDYEVIVTDSGSTDSTKKKALEFKSKIPNLHILEHKCKNVSEARNLGAKGAKGEFIVFFDSDVQIENNFLSEVKNKIDKYKITALTVWNRDKNNDIKGIILLGLLNVSMSFSQFTKPAANGPCIILSNNIFRKINGFDTSIVFGEDFDLIQRAVKNGAKFKVFRKPILYVSTRRFAKEGFIVSLYKSTKAVFHQLFIGPIRKPIFDYQMGGQYYQDKNKK